MEETSHEEMRKLQRIQWTVLGLAGIAIISWETFYFVVRKEPLLECLLESLIGTAIAAILLQFCFKIVYRIQHQLLRQTNLLAVLHHITATLNSTMNLDEILRTTAAGLSQVFEVEQCKVFIFDEERKFGRLAAEYPPDQENKSMTIPLRGDLPLERVITTKQPLTIENAQNDPLLAGGTEATGQHNVKSTLVVPLVLKEGVIGIVSLSAMKDKRTFSAEESTLAQTIANQVAVAIENARLYQQLIEEKATTEIILQETFSGIVVVDGSLRIVSLNPGAELISGFSAKEVLGRRLHEVFGVAITAPSSPLARAIETGEKVPPIETTLICRQGTKEVLLGATPLPSTGKQASRYLLSFADISKLKEIDRLKSSIVTNVSHELRVPLASIKAYTELLLGETEETDRELRREWLSLIDQETEQMISLINELLNLARLESGHFELTKVPLHLGEVIAQVVALLQVQAQRQRITINLKVQPDLPQLLADEELIKIAVKNLVSNAIKFSHEGGHIHIAVWQDGEALKFYVEDKGIGIPREAIPHLFTKFFRVPSSAAAGVQGTGLGLALAKEAVAAHGGDISVESAVGAGSRFTVTIPIVSEPSPNKKVA